MHCNARYFAQQQIMLLLANILSLDGGWREEESMSSHMVFSRKVSSTLSSTNLLTNVGNSKIDQNWLYIEQIRVSPKTTSYQKLGNITLVLCQKYQIKLFRSKSIHGLCCCEIQTNWLPKRPIIGSFLPGKPFHNRIVQHSAGTPLIKLYDKISFYWLLLSNDWLIGLFFTNI